LTQSHRLVKRCTEITIIVWKHLTIFALKILHIIKVTETRKNKIQVKYYIRGNWGREVSRGQLPPPEKISREFILNESVNILRYSTWLVWPPPKKQLNLYTYILHSKYLFSCSPYYDLWLIRCQYLILLRIVFYGSLLQYLKSWKPNKKTWKE